jgi:hypothetical protein
MNVYQKPAAGLKGNTSREKAHYGYKLLISKYFNEIREARIVLNERRDRSKKNRCRRMDESSVIAMGCALASTKGMERKPYSKRPCD